MATSGLEFHWFPNPLVVAEDIKAGAFAVNNLEIPMELSIVPAGDAMTRTFGEEGPGWAAWAESYAPFALAYPNVGILWQTGDLLGSVADEANFVVTPRTLSWTGATSPDYWRFHEEGTSKMPARKFVGLDEIAIAEIYAIFGEYLDGIVSEMAGHGFTHAPTGRGSTIRGPGGRFAPMNTASNFGSFV